MDHFKQKNFFFPIVGLTVFSIVLIATLIAYHSISMFEIYINHDIEKLQNQYLQEHKKDVKLQVETVLNNISFQISKVEEAAQNRLNERLEIATKVINFIYSQKKDQLSKKQILKLIAKHFSALTYGKDGYFFIYDYKTNIVQFHIQKKYIGQNISKFKNQQGVSKAELYKKLLKNKKIAYTKIYFSKPSDPNHKYKKLIALTQFQPLNITIGTGIYIDEIMTTVKKHVLERFNNSKMTKNNYIFFMKLHNINGGKHFATMILNPNRPDLINKKLDDDLKDANGKYYRKEYLKLLREKGSGFIKYYYKKPYKTVQKPKISYFALQKQWNWIIASGFYYDDLQKSINSMKKNLYYYSDTIIKKTIVWIVFLSIFIIIIAVFIASRINTTIKVYTQKIVQLNNDLENKSIQLERNMNIITENVAISKTDLHGIITEVSDAFCKLSGYTRDELIGKAHNIVRHPDMPKYAFKDLWNTIKQNKIWNAEVKNLRKDGSFYWFIVNISPEFDLNGNKIGYMAIRTDITAKKQYEQEHARLIQSEKLASMGELIGNIAHQWRQPLSVISTSASAIELKYNMDDLTNKDIEKFCGSIENSTQYLSKIINSFNTFIQDKQIKTFLNIKDEINSFLHLMQEDIKSNHIKIILDIDEKIQILGYKNTLTQCFINIFHNSKDIFEEKNLNTRLFFIDVKKYNEKVIILLKDNAGGVDKNIIDKIFEPYFTTKHQSQGTGLGLHTVYNIINQLNGTIKVLNISYMYEGITYNGAQFKIELENLEK